MFIANKKGKTITLTKRVRRKGRRVRKESIFEKVKIPAKNIISLKETPAYTFVVYLEDGIRYKIRVKERIDTIDKMMTKANNPLVHIV